MEELLKLVEKLSKEDNEQNKLLKIFYKKISEFKQSDKNESGYLTEYILPKIFKLCNKDIVRKDILFLSLISCRNTELLQKFIKYNEKAVEISLENPTMLYNYCLYKNSHWFNQIIHSDKIFISNRTILNKIFTIQLLYLTNFNQLDLEQLKHLLAEIGQDDIDPFWKTYFKFLKYFVRVAECYGNKIPKFNVQQMFKYFLNNSILQTFSNFLELKNENLEEISNFIKEEERSFEVHDVQSLQFESFFILGSLFNCITRKHDLNISNTVYDIKKKLLSISNLSLQLELLENIFISLFTETNYLSKTDDSKNICEEREVRLILYLVKEVLDNIKLKNVPQKDSADYTRLSHLNKVIADGMWRMELIRSVKSNIKCEQYLLKYMLSDPESLIQMCLKRSDFERAFQVIKIFDLDDPYLTKDIEFSQNLVNLRDTLKKTFKIKAIQKTNPNISVSNLDLAADKYVEQFFKKSVVNPNTENRIKHISEKYNFFKHFTSVNEVFMNIIDLAITLPQNFENCETILNIACEHNTLDSGISSNYYKFCKKLLELYTEVGKEKNISIGELLTTSEYFIDLSKYNKEKQFFNSLSQIFNEVTEDLNLNEPGILNNKHPAHKSFLKLNKLCSDYLNTNFTENIKYLPKLYNYLKAFSRILYIEQNTSDIISKGKNTSYFDLLVFNRSELMGKLLFERNLDPSEFEKYFGKLKLDYLYHVVGNCFPTINLHIQENITKDELYPENNLYVPTKSIIAYIQKRNWLLAYILNQMYTVDGVTMDISEVRVRVFMNYLALEKISNLKQLFNDNAIITAMQNEINIQKLSDFINNKILQQESLSNINYSQNSNDSLETGEELREDMLKSINWKSIFDLIRSVPESQLQKNRVLLDMMDTVLVTLTQDQFEPEYYRFVLFINNRDVRIKVIIDHMKHWSGEFCLDIIQTELSRFDCMQDGKLVELKMWLLHIKLCEKLKVVLDVPSWYAAYKMCENEKHIVINKLLESLDINLLLDFIDLHNPNETLLETIKEMYFVAIFDRIDQFDSIKLLLAALPFNHSIRICYSLIKMLKRLEHLKFVVDYLLNNVTNESLKSVELSLKMLSVFSQCEHDQLLCLLYDPLSIIEILIMNTKMDKLASVLNILKSEIPQMEFNEERISVEKIDEVLRTYAEKSLDFRVITQPNPRLLRTPECKLMQSLDSLNLGIYNKTFVMPDEIPLKDDWISNNEVLECMCCQKITFSMFNRRHHCRRCGRVVCYNCSLQRMLVPTYGDILVRVCLDCYHQTIGESDSSDINESTSSKSVDFDYWLLNDDENHNKIVREEFSYEHAPSVSLCLSLMKYHSKTVEYPKFLIDQCNIMLKLLQPSQEPIQEIDYLLVIKMLKSLAITAKMSSLECSLHYGTSLADRILSQADLLSLLAERGCLSLLPISSSYSQGPYIDASILRRLRDRLLEREQWNLALEVSTKAGLDNTGVFAVWGKSCLKAGSLQVAREKFQRCFDKTSPYDNLSDYSVSYESSENLSRSRNFSKSSNISSLSETKPLKNPPLLNEIIRILELNTTIIDSDIVKENIKENLLESSITLDQSYTLNQSESAICILNKLKNLKNISSKCYYQSVENELRLHAARPPINRIFYDECVYYLSRYGSHLGLLDFYIKHGDINVALNYILDNRLGTDIFIEIYMKCLKDGVIGILQENISFIDSTLDLWKDYLRHICRHLEKHSMLHSLYQLQQFMGDSIRAAMTCIRFYKENALNFNDLLNAVHYLHKAEEHLKHGLEQDQWVEVAAVRRVSCGSRASFEEKGIINPSLVMKISVKDINKHINTIWRQIELTEFLARCEEISEVKPMPIYLEMKNPDNTSPKSSDDKSRIPTLFGSTQDKIHLAVLAIICGNAVEDGFQIAIKIIEDFCLKPVKIFCEAGKELAKAERYNGIAQLVNCIKQSGTNDVTVTDMCDEMLTLAVATFTKANVSGTKVEDLIKLISDKSTKISAYIEAKQLKTAYFLAVKYKRMSEIRRILREAELLNQPNIKALCQKVLQSHSHTPTHSSKE